MTNKELIAELQKLPLDMEVQVWSPEKSQERFCQIAQVRTSNGDKKKVFIFLSNEPNMSPIPDYGDLVTIKTFRKWANDKTDSDGSGYWATKTEQSDMLVLPSEAEFVTLPAWATHVIWFNK